jgi:hypothetical protein
VANPSLVILQVLVVRQRDWYEVAHGRSIGSPSDSGRTHFAADDDRISIMPVEQLETASRMRSTRGVRPAFDDLAASTPWDTPD